MELSKKNNFLNDKRGNMVIFFTQGKKTNFIKILKLLYLADEMAIMESGVPISWLEYKAWMRGPVPSDLFLEAENMVSGNTQTSGENNLKSYVDVVLDNVVLGHKKTMSVIPLKPFNDDEFSDFEINILEKTMQEFGNLSATKLVTLTHAENSLWDEVVKANDLKKAFQINARTEYPVSLYKLIKGKKFEVYKNAVDTLKHELSM